MEAAIVRLFQTGLFPPDIKQTMKVIWHYNIIYHAYILVTIRRFSKPVVQDGAQRTEMHLHIVDMPQLCLHVACADSYEI